jgi:hypothetical protein
VNEQTTFNMRLAADLKEVFLKAAKSQDQDGAQLVRAFMRDYVRQNAQGYLLSGASPVKAAKRPKG